MEAPETRPRDRILGEREARRVTDHEIRIQVEIDVDCESVVRTLYIQPWPQ